MLGAIITGTLRLIGHWQRLVSEVYFKGIQSDQLVYMDVKILTELKRLDTVSNGQERMIFPPWADHGLLYTVVNSPLELPKTCIVATCPALGPYATNAIIPDMHA